MRLNAIALAFAAALHAFDARLAETRAGMTVLHDSLLHYNMLLDWIRHGDSPRGFTLTPSPYFLDMLVELPLMLLASDFERWSYALGFAYAVLLFGALVLVARILLGGRTAVAALAAGATLVVFYRLAPFDIVFHAFVVNHTSEAFATLGLLALVHALFGPDARPRRSAPYLYAAAVAVGVASSPFFIATYCLPVTAGALALVGVELPWRRLARFVGLTAVGALAGLVALAVLSRYLWPIRGDYYGDRWRSLLVFKHSLIVEPGGRAMALAAIAASLAAGVLVFVGRRRRWSPPIVFALGFLPACVAACTALPILRGAFYTPYELRFVTFPCLLVIAFYVIAAVRLVLRAAARWKPPRWLPWTAGALGAAAIALAVTCRGSLTMDDGGSYTSPMLRCLRAAERDGGVQDGLATWYLARYWNAARYAADWESPYVVVQIQEGELAALDPRDNNVAWFDGTYRGGAARIDFVATLGVSSSVLAFFREHVGPPDRTITCPVPLPGGGPTTFDLWIWDRADAQRRLADFVTHDNGRAPFAPIVGATRMSIDVEWGVHGDARLANGHRVWQRAGTGSGAVVTAIDPIWLPTGRYRIELEIAAPTGADPVAEIRVTQDQRELTRYPIVSGDAHPNFELDVTNRGPTSGAPIAIEIVDGSADAIDIGGASVTLVDQPGISPFGIFR